MLRLTRLGGGVASSMSRVCSRVTSGDASAAGATASARGAHTASHAANSEARQYGTVAIVSPSPAPPLPLPPLPTSLASTGRLAVPLHAVEDQLLGNQIIRQRHPKAARTTSPRATRREGRSPGDVRINASDLAQQQPPGTATAATATHTNVARTHARSTQPTLEASFAALERARDQARELHAAYSPDSGVVRPAQRRMWAEIVQGTEKALRAIRGAVIIKGTDATRALTASQYKFIFLRIKEERVFSEALPFWRLLQAQLQEQWRREAADAEAANRKHATDDTAISEGTHPTSRTYIGYLPVRLVSIVLHCLASAPDCGPEGAAAALDWMRAQQTKDGPQRFSINAGSFTPILKAYASRTPVDLSVVRAYFDSIPTELSNEFALSILMDAYINAGRLDEARELTTALRNSGGRLDVVVTANHLKLLLVSAERLDLGSDEHRAVLLEAEKWWSHAKTHHAQLLDGGGVTSSMMKLYQRGDANNLARQLEVLNEARQLESAAVAAAAAGATNKMTAEHLPSNRPIYVSSTCINLFVHSCTSCLHPAAMSRVVSDLWQWATKRDQLVAPVMGASKDPEVHERLQLIRVDQVMISSFLRYYQRSRLDDDLLRLWSAVSNESKRTNPQCFLVMLTHCASHWATKEPTNQANRLMAEYESLGIPWQSSIFGAWISCYASNGDVARAERVWQRMIDVGVQPDSSVYTRLMKVYITASARDPTMAHHIDRIIAAMQTGGPRGQPITFNAVDYTHLIRRSHGAQATQLMTRWRMMAAADQVTLMQC